MDFSSMNLSSCFLNPLYVWHLSKNSSIAVPHIRTSLSAFTLPCAHFTWCPPTLALEDSSISAHLLHATCFIHLCHIPPAIFPFLGWKVLSLFNWFLCGSIFFPLTVLFALLCIFFFLLCSFWDRGWIQTAPAWCVFTLLSIPLLAFGLLSEYLHFWALR